MTEIYHGAIEAGGTKFICAIGTPDGRLLYEERIATTAPSETMARVADFFCSASLPIARLGVGSFGPLDLDPDSPSYGCITSTPKREWVNFDLLGHLRKALRIPVTITTDVNAAAIGEYRWGAGQGLRNFLYVTVGTGIGGAAMVNGTVLHGRSHPEMGHILVPHDRVRDPFDGVCPYHGDCLEGLAAGPAIEARWGRPASDLPPDHPAWNLEIEYLALACVNWMLMFSPQRILLGGGVMRPELFPPLRARVGELLNRYLGDVEQCVIPPGLGARAGILGALAVAGAC